MSNIIDSIQLSGVTYGIKGSGGTETIELTQAQYDALVDKDPNVFYIITDAQAGDLTNYYTKTETNTLLGGKQDTLVSGTNIKTINNTSLLGSGNIDIQGSGKAIEAGRGIAITTGATADTVSFNLPISADSNTYINAGVGNTNNNTVLNILIGSGNTAFNGNSGNITGGTAIGFGNQVGYIGSGSFSKSYSFAFGYDNKIQGGHSYAIGYNNNIGSGTVNSKDNSFLIGYYNTCSFNGDSRGNYIFGNYCTVTKSDEFALGKYNASNNGSTDADKTFFSIGNGTSTSARHNAFEIRQNGDIYISLNGQDVKLQDKLGGGGSSYTAGDGIDITNDVISVTGKADTSAVTAIQDSLSGYVTTDTEQTISGKKIFAYAGSSSNKAIEFKQTSDSSKVGFVVKNSAATNNELATFEFRPNTFTIDGVKHPLLYFGHYRNTNTANAGVPQTVIGFRQYDQLNAAAYHYLIPLPEKAKTPFSLTTSFKDYYAPIGFKNGSTMITADNTGVVDLSSELGGLKLKKLTKAEYDALATKDSNTLYVIVN